MGSAELLEVMARLAEIQGALAQVGDARTFLGAVGLALEPLGPAYIDLAHVYSDATGAPASFEIVESWAAGALLVDSPLVGGPYPIADFPFARLALRSLREPQVFADIAAAPELDRAMRFVGRAVASAMIVPLYSERHAAWQGVLGVYWGTRHDPDAGELALCRVLMRLFAETLASERTQRALQDSLQRNEALLGRTASILRETEAQKATQRVLLENLPLGVAVVHGETGQRELVNRRGLELLGEHGDAAQAVQATEPFVYRPGEATPLAADQLPHAITLATGETQVAELELEQEGGRRSLIEVTTSLLRYPGDPSPRVVFLYQDITAVRRAELEQLRTQDALLQAQARALVERSTPLIPVRDDVLVMPIIGTIDAPRGRQIVEALGHLGGASRVRAVIIDITGVRELDEAAASTLVGAARMLRLRGVQPLLTGVQPKIAATLVRLGVDLSGIAVYGTLHAAVLRASEGVALHLT